MQLLTSQRLSTPFLEIEEEIQDMMISDEHDNKPKDMKLPIHEILEVDESKNMFNYPCTRTGSLASNGKDSQPTISVMDNF